MSAVDLIVAMQPSASVTAVKSTAPQAAAVAQPQPAANASSVAISSDGAVRARYEQLMTEVAAGLDQLRAINLSSSNLSSPAAAQLAYDMAHANLSDGMGAETGGSGILNICAGLDISGTLPGGGDGILRYAYRGEPVTPESQAYWKQQATSYQKDLLQLYNSEVEKKTPPGEILNKFLDLQSQQPDRFRLMMMWPPAADLANNPPALTYGGLKAG